MPKAARIFSAPIARPAAAYDKSEGHPLVAIALFAGIGLLASLIAMLTGVQGAWY